MTDTKFERLCCVFFNASPKRPPVLTDAKRDEIRRGVAALLREMREPDERMRDAAFRLRQEVMGTTPTAHLQAMIDEILKDAPDD